MVPLIIQQETTEALVRKGKAPGYLGQPQLQKEETETTRQQGQQLEVWVALEIEQVMVAMVAMVGSVLAAVAVQVCLIPTIRVPVETAAVVASVFGPGD